MKERGHNTVAYYVLSSNQYRRKIANVSNNELASAPHPPILSYYFKTAIKRQSDGLPVIIIQPRMTSLKRFFGRCKLYLAHVPLGFED